VNAVSAEYERLLAGGELRPDEDQRRAVRVLDRLAADFARQESPGLWARLTGRVAKQPRGAYMWGGVGRGKSMLMDLAFSQIAAAPKRRVHFHEFMLEVHDRLKVARASETGDPVPPVARDVAAGASLLAFDEMVVNNSADAMILSRLFSRLLDNGVTVVTTSNRPPSDLYKDGLNREHFLPFIALVERELDVVPLNGPTDYRLQRLGGMPTWYVPNGPEATKSLSEAFFRLTDSPVEDRAKVPAEDIPVQGGRTLHVPKSLKGVAVFSFKRLCAEARGAPDYLAVARRYHTVILVGIPKLGPENRNEAARFVTLIDALYEHKVKLLAAADAHPAELYTQGTGAFEFERTASRLMEMQSQDYLAKGHGEADPSRVAPPACRV
jgi:cell division protein ZapE